GASFRFTVRATFTIDDLVGVGARWTHASSRSWSKAAKACGAFAERLRRVSSITSSLIRRSGTSARLDDEGMGGPSDGKGRREEDARIKENPEVTFWLGRCHIVPG